MKTVIQWVLFVLVLVVFGTGLTFTLLLLAVTPSPSAPYYNRFPIPKRYDHEPTQRVELHRVTPFQMFFICPGAYACTMIGSNPCQMYLPKGQAAYYWRHERAHCNGWPSNHPYP